MLKNTRIRGLVSVFGLSIAVFSVLFTPGAAFAATRTWDGGGVDSNLNTAANWSADTAPSAGDDLVFPSNQTKRTLVNNYTAATSFNSIAFTGVASSDSNYVISGNSMTLVAGINSAMTGNFAAHNIDLPLILNASQTIAVATDDLTLGGIISGTGNLTKTGTVGLGLLGANTFSGNFISNGGLIRVSGAGATLGTTAGSTQINAGSSLSILPGGSTYTSAEPITLSGAISGSSPKFSLAASTTGNEKPSTSATFSGAITLSSDITVFNNLYNVSLTNVTINAHTITRESGSFGDLTINGTLQADAPFGALDLSGDFPGNGVYIVNHYIGTLAGTYGDITVLYDAIFKGTGTIGVLTVNSGGKVAPGASPGCINTGDFVLTGTYEAEIGGTTACTGYDQLTVTGTVTLTGGTLTTLRYNNFVPANTQKYTLISNDGTDAVTGTFTGLAEGAIVTVEGYQFRISYVGGDGNDVVLSAVNVPGTPNTGFGMAAENPILTLSLITGMAITVGVIARKIRKPHAYRR